MKTATVCHEIPCDHSVAERPRYYAGKVITHYDLSLEQDYFRSKLRWHNRMLHGWGVVCGALVCRLPKSKENGTKFEPWKVIVKPGYILGPYGDEIIIDCTRTVDLRTQGVVGITGEPCVDAVDPWCTNVVQEPSGNKLYIAVRYKEVPARPVRVQPIGCGCDDSQCENSRYVDGYEIAVLDHCPNSEDIPPRRIKKVEAGPIPECPPCPDEPWVGLAEVEIDADGNVTIDNCACRRLVVSLANTWWQCSDEPAQITPKEPQPSDTEQPTPAPVDRSDLIRITAVRPERRLERATENTITVTGQNLDTVRNVSFGAGSGINVAKFEATPNQLVIQVKLDPQAVAGPRTMVLTDSNNKQTTLAGVVTIEEPAVPAGNPSQPAPPSQPPATGTGSAQQDPNKQSSAQPQANKTVSAQAIKKQLAKKGPRRKTPKEEV